MSHYEAPIREPLIIGHKTYHDITEDIAKPIEERAGKLWWISLYAALVLFIYGFGCIAYTIGTGIGSWGLNRTINWGWDITNFVWWVGIGHAGTLISAVLLLFRQRWRMSVNRSAEAMTIFAVVQAAIFPVIHMGRVWVGYWVFPLPNQFGSLWGNFNSPLLWDVFAISTYFSVSTVFWFMGLIPDFAMIRDRAKTPWTKKIYTFLAFGWGGKAKHWQRFEELSLVLAGLATPLVFSVHTTVSFDFATSVIKGWHSTIYPPYFVAGAIFSGFAMVQTLLLVARKVCHLEDYITMYHIEIMNIVIILTGGMVTVAYATEYFIGWYSGSRFEDFTYLSPGAATGPYWWAFWALIICNLVIPALFWFKRIRTNIFATFFIALIINIGMWFERFDIIVINLSRDYLPGSWTMFKPTIIDVGVYLGTIGFFGVLFLLYARTFPVIAQAELKSILKISGETYKAKKKEMSTTKIVYGLYADDDDLMQGVKAFNDKGIAINEVYTPFPVHGLDKALGLKKTRISDAAFLYAVYGITIGSLVTWYTMNHDWPQNIGGKPAFDWAHNMPAFVVPMFELMVFCSAHMMSWTFLIRNKMYPMAPAQNPDPRTTDDKFMMEFVTEDVDAVKQLLIDTGAEEITVKDANHDEESKD